MRDIQIDKYKNVDGLRRLGSIALPVAYGRIDGDSYSRLRSASIRASTLPDYTARALARSIVEDDDAWGDAAIEVRCGTAIHVLAHLEAPGLDDLELAGRIDLAYRELSEDHDVAFSAADAHAIVSEATDSSGYDEWFDWWRARPRRETEEPQ